MIVLVRVDDRLVHGQVVESWVPFLKADYILVASDDAAANRFKRLAIESCGFSSLTIHVLGINDAIREIKSGNMDERRTIVLVGTLDDAMRLCEGGVKVTGINMGNIHHGGETKQISRSVYIDKVDEGIIERLKSMGVPIQIRAVPYDRPIDL